MEGDWYNDKNEVLGEVLLDAATIRMRVQELGALITKDYRGKNPHLIGILKGASVFHADLVRAIGLVVSVDFIAVGSYGTSTKSSGEVEDILDTGLTLSYLLQILESRGPRSLKVVALLNKPSRRIIEVPAEYIGFEIPDHFVVGYGLDFNQRYRNLPDITVLKVDPGES